MTEIEDTLSGDLAAEADRHEPPVFDARRIAEAATARRRFTRRPLFALAAALVGTAGVGGATVFAAGGGQHRPADQVTVTIQSPAGSAGPLSSDGAVKAWVSRRAAAEGLKDVTATVKHDPWRLEVSGHAGDLDLLKTFGEPGILQLRPITEVPTPSAGGSATEPCQVSVGKSGNAWRACASGIDGIDSYWVTDPVGVSYRVVSAQAVLFSPSSGPGPVWGVMVTLDPAGAKALGGYSTQFLRKTSAVMIDGAVATTWNYPSPVTDGKFGFEAASTAKRATLLAQILTTQGFPGLEGATVTVSTR